jgi:hypothetical protein
MESGAKLDGIGESVRVQGPDSSVWKIPSNNLLPALKNGAKLDEAGWGDVAQGFIKGAATGIGKVADTGVAALSKVASYLDPTPIAAQGMVSPEEQQQYKQTTSDVANDFWQNDKIAKVASDSLDTGVGYDQSVRVADVAGETVQDLATLFTGAGAVKLATKAGKIAKLPWVQKLNALINTPITAKNAASFAAMGGAGEYAKQEGVGELGQFVASIFGGTIPHYGAKSARAVANYVTSGEVKNLLAKANAKTLSAFGSEVDVAGYEALQRKGVKDVPADLVLKKNSLASVLGKVRTEVTDIALTNASEQTIKDIEKSLEEVVGKRYKAGDGQSAATIATQDVTKKLQEEVTQREAIKTQLYADAKAAIKPKTDAFGQTKVDYSIQPLDGLKAAKDLYKTTGSAIEGAYNWRNKVAGTANRVVRDLTQEGQTQTTNIDYITNTLQDLKALVRDGEAAGEGLPKLINNVINGLESDLERTFGKEYFQKYKAANQYFKDELVDLARTEVAKTILKGEAQIGLYDLTGSVDKLNALEKVLTKHPKGKELLGSLKATRAYDLLASNKVFVGEELGEFNAAGFQKFFSQNVGAKKDTYLGKIFGEGFDIIKKDNKDIAEAFVRTAENMKNPGTAKNLVALSGMAQIGTGVLTADPARLAKGTSLLFAPKLFAKVMLRPAVSRELVKAAKNKNDKRFMQILFDNAKDITNTVIKSPATKYQAVNFGINTALPEAAKFGSDMLFGKEFTEKVKNKYNEKKSENSKKY